jgi:hypothetical protein
MPTSFYPHRDQKSIIVLPNVRIISPGCTAPTQNQSPTCSTRRDDFVYVSPEDFPSIHSVHHPYDYSDSYDEFSLYTTTLRSNPTPCSQNNRPIRLKNFFQKLVIRESL